ncbi:acyltransferase ChoActase/COT/CPT [Lipomyces arxii]|uniref:acyltransferase ChoActase/COT/CPT n=1 Tax=Lipomyces arxii TaxID=56418 RepID=UPI0034CF7427
MPSSPPTKSLSSTSNNTPMLRVNMRQLSYNRLCGITKAKMLPRPFGTVSINKSAATAAAVPKQEHAYVEDITAGKMLRFQESLPRLPVPSLKDTAAVYLKSVHPIVSPEQFRNTVNVVQKFISDQGEGPALQKRLLAKATDPNVKNWVYDWWNDAAYMSYRDPVVPYVSYFYGHKDDPVRKTAASRGAAIVTAALDFKMLVDSKNLEPEYLKRRPLCMDSYKWMFNACRIPAPGSDHAVKYSPESPENKTITVIRKNRFYDLPYEVDGVQLSTAELEAQLAKIIADADAQPKAPAVGAISSANRDREVVYRNHLRSDPTNAKLLARVEASAFVLALDDGTSPSSLTERAHQFWHGDGANRWYDKPCQFIVCDNGVSGFMGEHSMMDGTPTCRLNDYVCDVILNNKVSHGSSLRQLPPPQELKFSVSDIVQADLAEAQEAFKKEIGLHEVEVLAYTRFGKDLIKTFKASPDAYVQMALQLAHYRMFGCLRPTYESATTRQYQLGRTEVCRSASDDALSFVEAFGKTDVSPSEKVALMRQAMNAHVEYVGAATAGFGCDRHLFGLKNLVDKGSPMPEIFTDPTYGFSTTWIFSTSQLSSEFFNAYGWSQVTDKGFGIAYMINGGSLQFNVCSKFQNSPELSRQIGKALDDMADMFQTAEPPKAKL